MKTVEEISKQLGFEWTVVAYELGFTREEVKEFHVKVQQKESPAKSMLECWYEYGIILSDGTTRMNLLSYYLISSDAFVHLKAERTILAKGC